MPSPGNEKEIVIEDREELIFLLSEAATLEHMVMCGYLYAAFSMKHENGQGLDSQELKLVGEWDRTISQVAVQEMLHLALVNNLLTSIGAAPHFLRPNFPVRSKYFFSSSCRLNWVRMILFILESALVCIRNIVTPMAMLSTARAVSKEKSVIQLG